MTQLLKSVKSPNFDLREPDIAPDFLIMHYTACDLDESLKVLTDGNADNPVSAHYLIDEDGLVYHIVDEDRRAWHAGVSRWKDIEGLNSHSIGIELVNPGLGPDYRPFPEAQMTSLAKLSQGIIRRHNIPAEQVLGHSDIAPQRKQDPGELFNWQWLAEQGVGVFPDFSNAKTTSQDIHNVQKMLKTYGYDINVSGVHNGQSQKAVSAFQQHFRPKKVDGQVDEEMVGRLECLVRMFG